MKITKSQLVKIIKEEAENFKKEIKLKKELASIERQLNEVTTGGEMGSKENDGVHAGQKEPVFKKKGSHLVEVEDEMEMDQESVMSALKTIAKACGLTGTIELDSEDEESSDEEIGADDEMGADDEIEVDVVEPESEEEAGEEEEEEEEAGEEGEEEGEEEMEEVDMEENKDDKNVENKEEGNMMNEAIEKNRMMELAGIKKLI